MLQNYVKTECGSKKKWLLWIQELDATLAVLECFLKSAISKVLIDI